MDTLPTTDLGPWPEALSPRKLGKPSTMTGYPAHDGAWNDKVSLRRENMYGDDGR